MGVPPPGGQRAFVDGIDLGAEEAGRALWRGEVVLGGGDVDAVGIGAEQRLVTDAQHAVGVRRVDRVDGVRPERIARLADRQERVGASGQVSGGGIDVGLQHRVEPVAGVRVEVALRVAEEWPELAGAGVERRRHAVEHVQAQGWGRVLVLLGVEQADREVDLLPEEGGRPERPTAQPLVGRLDLEALREHLVADVQTLEPGLHLVGGDPLPGDRRRLQRRGRLAQRALGVAPLLERRELLRGGQVAQRRPILRGLGCGSRLADIHGAELLDRPGGPGRLRRDGHTEREHGSTGASHERAT